MRAVASKPQIQERMTTEILNMIVENLSPRFAMVYVEATHLCMVCRGVKSGGTAVTSALYYDPKDPLMRANWQRVKKEVIDTILLGRR